MEMLSSFSGCVSYSKRGKFSHLQPKKIIFVLEPHKVKRLVPYLDSQNKDTVIHDS